MSQGILIIGGGVIGLSIARELSKRGAKEITILERGLVGSEASWAAAGMLAPNIETDTDERFHRLGLDSLELYPDFAETLRAETGVDIELDRTGTLFLAFDEAEETQIDETLRRQLSRGVRVERLSSDEIRSLEPSISRAARAGLFYPNDWQVDNRKLVVALRSYAERNGIRIVENVNATSLLVSNRTVTGADTTAGEFRSGTTIVATGAWTSLIKIGDRKMPIDVIPIRGQMISYDTMGGTLRHVTYSANGYLVPRADGRLLVGATVEDVGFEKAVTEDGVESLVRAAVEIIPSLSPRPVASEWSGLRPFASDGLPVLGRIPEFDNAFVATAHYRNGILLAPKTAELMADAILDDAVSESLEIFGVGRFAAAANAHS